MIPALRFGWLHRQFDVRAGVEHANHGDNCKLTDLLPTIL